MQLKRCKGSKFIAKKHNGNEQKNNSLQLFS